MELYEARVVCPYCNESLHVLVEPQEVGDSYIEDCQVCCAPIEFRVMENMGAVEVEVFRQDESY